MRLPLPCDSCATATGTRTIALVFVELEGEHRFRITCPQGHDSVVGLRQPRFKILYESGALALLDGYYREAVASFASLERFHEYWLRATLLQTGISGDDIHDTWKPVAKQSERQYGAFLLLYLRERRVIPPYLPDKLVSFRNDVIHIGAFPSMLDTATYAEHVLRLIAPMNRELQKQAPTGVGALEEEQVKEIKATGDSAKAIATILGHATDIQPTQARLQDELDLLKQRRGGTDGRYLTSAPTFRPGGG